MLKKIFFILVLTKVVGLVYSQEKNNSFILPFKEKNVLVTSESSKYALNKVRNHPNDHPYTIAIFYSYPDFEGKLNKSFEIADHLFGKAYYIQIKDKSIVANLKEIKYWQEIHNWLKVDPDVFSERYGRFISVDSLSQSYNYVLNKDSTLNLIVFSYKNVTKSNFLSVIKNHAKIGQQHSTFSWGITCTRLQLLYLLNENKVRYIEPAPSPKELEIETEIRTGIGVSALQQIDLENGNIVGLTGKGIDVGIYDGGIDEEHSDLGGRIILHSGSKSSHGTHVAGIVAGNGFMSDKLDSHDNSNGGSRYDFRGIAPKTYLIDQVVNKDDFHINYRNIVQASMDISNHSYGVSYDGLYGSTNHLFDEIISGNSFYNGLLIPGRPRFFSAGNEGRAPRNNRREQSGYFSLTKQCKNGILVGNYNLEQSKINNGSSLGPTYDGRIKPDVVAPGSNIISTNYESLPDGAEIHNGFVRKSGTSMAAPMATGVTALLLEKYGIVYNKNIDIIAPLPSTIRAILANSATDIAAPAWFSNNDGPVVTFEGPDFVTGFGLINATGAIDLVTKKCIIEDTVNRICQRKSYRFLVSDEISDPLKVTLAWDDFPANTALNNTAVKLVNDLDMVLIDPGGVKHYPWKLNQTIRNPGNMILTDENQHCGEDILVERTLLPNPDVNFLNVDDPGNINDPVTISLLGPATKGKDHLNNIEQIVAPRISGYWTAIVTSFALPEGPQSYSIAGIKPVENILVDRNWLCRDLPISCDNIFQCYRFAGFCIPRTISQFDSGLNVQLNTPDPFVVRLDDICKLVLNCPGCNGSRNLCSGNYLVDFSGITNNYMLEVFNSYGKRILKKRLTANNAIFTLKHDERLKYFFSFQPLFNPDKGKIYSIPIALQSK